MKRIFPCKIVLFVLPLFTLPEVLTAQYRIDTWTTENGLPQNSVQSSVQTRDGYLWFTTNDGLVRFDGVRFKVFNKANSAGITNNRFGELLEDQSGRLWVSAEDGSLLFFEHGTFTVVVKPNDLQFNPRSSLVDDGAGSLIIGVAGQGQEYRHYQYRDGRLVPWEIAGLPPGAGINYRDRDGGFWFLDPLRFYRVKDGQQQSFAIPQSGYTRQVYEDRFGNFWLSADSKRIYRVSSNEVLEIETPITRVWGFAEDTAGNLWLSSFDNGALLLEAGKVNAAEIKLEHFRRFTVEDGLLSNISADLTTDREGGAWLGTSKGLHRLSPQTVRAFAKKDGLAEDNIYPILEDRSGTIWIGAWPQTLIRYRAGAFSTFLSNPDIPFYSSLFEDRDGKLWVGTDRSVMYLEDNKPVDFSDRTGVALPATFNVISQDRDGHLWFGTNKGLSRYASGTATLFTTKDGLPDNFVVALLQGRDGALWVGTRGGIAALENGDIKAFTEKEGLASNYTRSLYEDADGVLWIGSYDGGLTRYNDGQFTRFTTKDGLHSNGVFCILEDSRGWFWINSNQGIYRVRRQELNDFASGKTRFLTSIAYNRRDGLLNVEGNGGRQPAGIKARDGRMWFPMAEGVAVIDPNTVASNPLAPPVLIEEVTIDKQPVANDLFQSAITNPQSVIRLGPNQGNLEIHYTGLSFINSEQVKFKYKLEGLDPDWVEAGTRRAAYYSYLPSGNYTFRVIAANRDGVWNEAGASVAIEVLPPFYRTWWFLSLAVLFVSGVVFLAFRVRVSRLERERNAQEEFSRQLLASQEQERQRIAAELHDSLGQSLLIIKNRIALAHSEIDEKETVEEQLDELSQSASHAIEECREIAYNLRPFQLERFGLSRTLEGIFMRISEVTTINAIAEIEPIDSVLTDEAQINVYRIVQESVNNIIKHSGATDAKLVIKRDGSTISLLIRDNGRGFISSPEKSSGSPAKRGGFGLIGITERVKMLGGSLEIDSMRGTSIRIRLEGRGE